MIVLGLTGSIGMGKSVAARMLKWLGVPVHDSDAAVHAAMGGEACEAVKSAFPESFKDGAIDRKILGGIVFRDTEKLKILEGILHPIVQKSQEKFLGECRAQGKKIAALEIPLLFETGADERVDYTMVVSARADVQRARVLKRPGMTEDKFEAILAKQMPDAEKRERPDFVVDTGRGYISTFFQLIKSLYKIKTTDERR
jgi:dephospho-CoA kinase